MEASSGAATLYNAQFMDHVTNPDYCYALEGPTHWRAGVNPTCGDSLTFSIRMDADDRIEEAAYQGHGCAISQASADMMSDLMMGKTAKEAIELCQLFGRMVRGEVSDDDELQALDEAVLLRDISHMPARVKCAELAWHTLEEMLQDDSRGGRASTTEGEGV